MTKLSFIHRFEPGARSGSRPLLILHGTGGNENDLLLLGKMVAPGVPVLSPRGKVLEHGMPRLSLSQIRSAHIDDAIRPGRGG
jgi:phospholipase/carboxylesterase